MQLVHLEVILPKISGSCFFLKNHYNKMQLYPQKKLV